MPNWCSIVYKIKGDRKEISAFNKLLYTLRNRKTPVIRNGFGNLWLGCIIEKLGGRWQDIYCKGSIEDFKAARKSSVLTLYIEHAWSECMEFRQFLLSKFPSFEILYLADEPMMDYHVTNDVEGEFFPYRWCLRDSYRVEEVDFKDFESLKAYIKKELDIDITESDVREKLNEYNTRTDDIMCIYRINARRDDTSTN